MAHRCCIALITVYGSLETFPKTEMLIYSTTLSPPIESTAANFTNGTDEFIERPYMQTHIVPLPHTTVHSYTPEPTLTSFDPSITRAEVFGGTSNFTVS